MSLCSRGFPGSAVVKNLPANAGDTGSSPVREDPTCCRANKPMHHNYEACALEPMSHSYWNLHATTTEVHVPRACALQQEKPLQWEARALQQRVAPSHRN